MKIDDGKLYGFELPLSRPLPVARAEANSRAGIIVELVCDAGLTGFGEISPLPGYSRETLDEAVTEAQTVLRRLIGVEAPEHLHELSGGFRDWLGAFSRLPSVRFGFESAIMSLLADRSGQSVERLMTDNPATRVLVNGLLNGEPAKILERAAALVADGYAALKLKVGRLPMDIEVKLIADLRRTVGPEVRLRLDANRRFAIEEAIRFANSVEPFDIEYIEEPAESTTALRTMLASDSLSIPIALDESLMDIEPEHLPKFHGVGAIVIKPTMLGLERAMMFARMALARGIRPVVSSTFETSVGMTMLARLAAVLPGETTPMGLDTLCWFDDDLVAPPLTTVGGRIGIRSLPDIATTLRRELLTEITDD